MRSPGPPASLRASPRLPGVLGLLGLLGLAACEPDLRSFALVEPAAGVELVPVAGDRFELAWTYESDDADEIYVLAVAVHDGDREHASLLTRAPLVDGHRTYYVPDPPRPDPWTSEPPPRAPPAGSYDVELWAHAGDYEPIARATAPGRLVMQGAVFADQELRFTGPADPGIRLTVASASVAHVTVYLAASGRAWILADWDTTGDPITVERVIPFTGVTLDGLAIPRGTYQAEVGVTARDGAVRYVDRGLTVHWDPS